MLTKTYRKSSSSHLHMLAAVHSISSVVYLFSIVDAFHRLPLLQQVAISITRFLFIDGRGCETTTV